MDKELDEESSNPSQSDYTDDEDEALQNQGEISEDGIQSDLKEQSLEQILSLKDSVGLRTYKTAIGLQEVGGSKKRKKVFKRENKNRPREISSKIPVSGERNIFAVKKKRFVLIPALKRVSTRFNRGTKSRLNIE